MLATATHDHKRGEDVRARLAAISEDPLAWAEHVSRWFEFNRRFSQDAIDPSDEYMLYQMIVGAWPLALDPGDADGLREFAERLAGWQMKALREAKVSSSWRAPDENYETSCRRFLETILSPGASEGFLADVADHVEKIARVGALNGITQAFLRCTVPGVPDLFQGCEFWDFSLVDPDNRRPVDFALREEALAAGVGLEELMASWRDGRIKQAVIHRALETRAAAGNLFLESEYIPLEIRGARASSVIAFARRRSSSLMIAAACRLAGEGLRETAQPTPPRFWWRDTAVIIPPDLVDTELSDAFGLAEPSPLGARIEAASLFRVIPVALRYVW
jgi:(1->4)-alpha-D-glucan 1-alpha-D-glucosylmutase